MKVILYMAISLDGFIATKNDEVDWVLKSQWEGYRQTIKDCGCAIVGRKTYELMPAEEFVPDCFFLVVTKDKNLKLKIEMSAAAESPKQAVELLKQKGFDKVCLVGGGEINGSFYNQDLIDEVMVDVEPVVLGEGIPLLAGAKKRVSLQLLEAKPLDDGGVRLRYKVRT